MVSKEKYYFQKRCKAVYYEGFCHTKNGYPLGRFKVKKKVGLIF